MKQKAEPVTSSFDVVVQSKWVVKHRYILVVIVLVALLMAGTTFFTIGIRKKNDSNTSSLEVCSVGKGEQLVKQAATEFSQADNYQLAMTTVKISELPKYQEDPNCLFVVTVNYVNSYQLSLAQKSLIKFNKLYNGHNLIAVLAKDQNSDSLSSRVAYLTRNAKKLNVEAIP